MGHCISQKEKGKQKQKNIHSQMATQESKNNNVEEEHVNEKSNQIKKRPTLSNREYYFDNIKKYYTIGCMIGSGGFGQVRICTKIGDNNNKVYALKSIYRNKFVQDIIKEVEILISLDHPNIIKFYEYFIDDDFVHIIMEFCTGGDLIEKIKTEKNLREHTVCNLIFKVLSAIKYCHSKGIAHRDLKPDNIMFESKNETEIEIKIIDFNLSKQQTNKNNMQSVIGTPYYMAPEVIMGDYNEKCDIWAIGIITYFAISGALPFDDSKSLFNVYNKIINEKLEFKSEIWERVSFHCKDFIQKCLEKDPEKRIDSINGVIHPWFKIIRNSLSLLSNNNNEVFKKDFKEKLQNLKSFIHYQKFKKLVIKFIINNVLSNDEITRLKSIFTSMDQANTGFIEVDELSKAFEQAEVQFSKEELEKIIHNCDDQNNGKLDYSEFLVGSLNPNAYFNRLILKFAFDQLDQNKDGMICQEDLHAFFIRSGNRNVTSEYMTEIIKEVTSGDHEKINFEDMYHLFQNEHYNTNNKSIAKIIDKSCDDNIKEDLKL